MTWSAKLARWLSVNDAGTAVDFYKSAFGAVEPERLEGDVGVLQVARLGIGEADFWVQFDPGGNPHALGGSARPHDPDRGRPDARRVQKS
jgi:uncharacterized glyoxalase superfamily protein PhnB